MIVYLLIEYFSNIVFMTERIICAPLNLNDNVRKHYGVIQEAAKLTLYVCTCDRNGQWVSLTWTAKHSLIVNIKQHQTEVISRKKLKTCRYGSSQHKPHGKNKRSRTFNLNNAFIVSVSALMSEETGFLFSERRMYSVFGFLFGKGGDVIKFSVSEWSRGAIKQIRKTK